MADRPEQALGAEEVEQRLRTVARLLAARGFVVKGPEMSGAAITARLRTMGALSDMCQRLSAILPRPR